MPKFNCSYAYDVPEYADFVVEADSPEHAQQLIEAALKADRFLQVEGEACWENVCNHRVFVSGPARPEDTHQPTLDELCAEP